MGNDEGDFVRREACGIDLLSELLAFFRRRDAGEIMRDMERRKGREAKGGMASVPMCTYPSSLLWRDILLAYTWGGIKDRCNMRAMARSSQMPISSQYVHPKTRERVTPDNGYDDGATETTNLVHFRHGDSWS